MAVQVLYDRGIELTPEVDAGVYACAITDGVVKGIGNNFNLNYSENSLDVSFSAGSMAVICGAFFKVTSTTSVRLTANSTIYLCASIDKSVADGTKGSFVMRTISNMKSENLNASGKVRDLLLYIITTSGTGVQSVVDKRTYSAINSTKLSITSGGKTVATFPNADGEDTTIDLDVCRWGIDASKLIKSFNQNSTATYTANQDSVVLLDQAAPYFGVYIDGVKLWGTNQGTYTIPKIVPLKNGQTIMLTTDSAWYVKFRIFAMK